MRRLIKKYRIHLIVLFVLLSLYLIMLMLGITCPIKFLTGVSCPGCGMTRAHIAAFTLRFGQAFYYHPLWPLCIPVILGSVIASHKKKRILFKIILSVSVIALIAVYVIRLFNDSDVVSVVFEDGLIYKMLRIFKNSGI